MMQDVFLQFPSQIKVLSSVNCNFRC